MLRQHSDVLSNPLIDFEGFTLPVLNLSEMESNLYGLSPKSPIQEYLKI
jgi:hypothetical protein